MRHKTWALVTNGLQSRILRGFEDGFSEDAIEIASEAESTHLKDILADKPGRGFASATGGRRSAMEPGSDPILRDMQDFAREILRTLEGHMRGGRLTRLAVFAAPKMLGILRQEMPPGLRDAVCLEKDLNLINLSDHELKETVRNTIQETAPR